MKLNLTLEQWREKTTPELAKIYVVADRLNNHLAKQYIDAVLAERRLERAQTTRNYGINAVHLKNGTTLKMPFAWGSVRPSDKVIFLNVWSDEVVSGWVNIHEDNDAYRMHNINYRERILHCDSLLRGARGFAIICIALFDKRNKRSIKSQAADAYPVLPILEVERRKENKEIWARIE